jgi:hypothetical protein
MTQLLAQFSYVIAITVFLSDGGIHLARKNINCVVFYIIPSVAVAVLLFIPAFKELDFFLMLAQF